MTPGRLEAGHLAPGSVDRAGQHGGKGLGRAQEKPLRGEQGDEQRSQERLASPSHLRTIQSPSAGAWRRADWIRRAFATSSSASARLPCRV